VTHLTFLRRLEAWPLDCNAWRQVPTHRKVRESAMQMPAQARVETPASRVRRGHIELDRESLRRNTYELYSLLGALGDRLYLESLALCDDEQQAAAWASAQLVCALERQRAARRASSAP